MVGVSDLGSLGGLDKINVHFFWRRVYKPLKLGSIISLSHCIYICAVLLQGDFQLINIRLNEWSSHSASIFNDLLVRQQLLPDHHVYKYPSLFFLQTPGIQKGDVAMVPMLGEVLQDEATSPFYSNTSATPKSKKSQKINICSFRFRSYRYV